MTDMDFEERKMEYDFNKFCRESCEEILSKDESVKWRKSEIIYSDLDHSLVRFDGKTMKKMCIFILGYFIQKMMIGMKQCLLF